MTAQKLPPSGFLPQKRVVFQVSGVKITRKVVEELQNKISRINMKNYWVRNLNILHKIFGNIAR